MKHPFPFADIADILLGTPNAYAALEGSDAHPNLRGVIGFYATDKGTLCAAKFSGLPQGSLCKKGIFALHIHQGEACTGEAFADAGAHFDPNTCPHPYHAGDLPPVFESHAGGLMICLSDRFTPTQIIGRTVILHDGPDDFTTQPSGAAGEKIACGIIHPY